MATTVVVLTSGTSWTVPAGWSNSSNSIEVIGGGGGGGGAFPNTYLGPGWNIGPGGGGGGYAKVSNIVLTPGTVLSYSIGSGGAGGPANTSIPADNSGFAGGTTSISSPGGVLISATGGGRGQSRRASNGGRDTTPDGIGNPAGTGGTGSSGAGLAAATYGSLLTRTGGTGCGFRESSSAYFDGASGAPGGGAGGPNSNGYSFEQAGWTSSLASTGYGPPGDAPGYPGGGGYAGDGGTGTSYASVFTNVGHLYGGGGAGGGARSSPATYATGGAGAQGAIIITYGTTPAIASRLTSTGTYLISGEFDEVTTSSIRLTVSNQYAALLDEVTLQPVSPPLNLTSNINQVFVGMYGAGGNGAGVPVELGFYYGGTAFPDAIVADLVPIGSRVYVKWSYIAYVGSTAGALVDMGIVSAVVKNGNNSYVIVSNPNGVDRPFQAPDPVNGFINTAIVAYSASQVYIEYPAAAAKRETSTGTLMVSGYFNEVDKPT